MLYKSNYLYKFMRRLFPADFPRVDILQGLPGQAFAAEGHDGLQFDFQHGAFIVAKQLCDQKVFFFVSGGALLSTSTAAILRD